MRTIEITVYSFDELSKEAQQKAIDTLCSINVDYETIKANDYEFTENGNLIQHYTTTRTINNMLHQSAIDSEAFNRTLTYITIAIIAVAFVINLINL